MNTKARPGGCCDPDPILSPAQMCADGGISPSTWNRNWRHRLPMVRISPRRIGCRQSDWRAALEAEIGKLPTQADQRRGVTPVL